MIKQFDIERYVWRRYVYGFEKYIIKQYNKQNDIVKLYTIIDMLRDYVKENNIDQIINNKNIDG